MDFFGHQEAARRATGRLVALFVLAVLGIIGCIYAAAQGLLFVADHHAHFEPALLLVVALVTFAIIGLAMTWKTAQLRSGGGQVAQLLGGTEVGLDPVDPKERMLRNIVEEIAIAAGVPVPEIWVLEDESGINAFAAGWSPADAAVAVTRGCLESLDRDELQGVIAHEFSHVFHGDMRLNIRLMGVLFGIVCIATIGRIVVQSVGRGRSDKKGGVAAIVAFGVSLLVIGWLGVLFARLIQAAVSRQREFLADASAVQYTRNPRGIGLALAKIGGLTGRLATPHAEEACHMLFADGVKRMFGSAFATHPPVTERVERILPGFAKQLRSASSMVEAAAATPLPPGFAEMPPGAGALAAMAAASALAPASARGLGSKALVAAIGEMQPAHVDAAKQLLAALPMDLAAATHEPARAAALLCAILLDREPVRREAQLLLLAGAGPAFVHETRAAFQAVARLERDLRLPLVELAMPALRALPSSERTALRERLRALALADGVLSPFEWALLRTVEQHVRAAGELPPRPPGRPDALAEHMREASVVLSVLARAGAHGDEARAAHAFARGQQALGLGAAMELQPAAAATIEALETAVEAFARVSPPGKRNLLAACAEAAADDGVLDPDEIDLLRALATLWDCPVPLVQAHG
jgi:Zn-dependent protease with chaperone function